MYKLTGTFTDQDPQTRCNVGDWQNKRQLLSGICDISYMATTREPALGPLFTWEDKQFLTREAFVAAVRGSIERGGLEAREYAGHSF